MNLRAIKLKEINPPSKINCLYFKKNGLPSQYLKNIAAKIIPYSYQLYKTDMKGVFVGGSNVDGSATKNSDLDIIIYRNREPNKICLERNNFVEEFEDTFPVMIRYWWGHTGKSNEIDFNFTSEPYGVLYDLINNNWVCVVGNKKHPLMNNRRNLFNNLPQEILNQDFGLINKYLWDQE